MKQTWLLRVLAALAIGALVVWFMMNTRWVEVDEPLPARGAALTDRYYALRKIVAASGTPLEIRAALEPMPPVNTTLVLDTAAWDLFPERDDRLKAWVEAGGHLVVVGPMVSPEQLRWIPLDFARPSRNAAPASGASQPAGPIASAPATAPKPPRTDDEDEDDGDEDDEEDDASSERAASAPTGIKRLPPGVAAGMADERRHCEIFKEPEDVAPAFEAGRRYVGCMYPVWLRAVRVQPTWGLSNSKNTLALRVPVGRGMVTGLSAWLPLNSRDLIAGDNALILAAAFALPSHRPLWLVESEAREPLPVWIWHNARAPLLLALAAIALALWRLMVRFGPREAALAQARRSMGEQLRGTGEFIASREPLALHAATRHALDEAARTRIEGYADLGDAGRVDALAQATGLEKAALRQSLRPSPSALPAQILAAIATLEQARRSLLRAAAPRS